MCFEWIDTLAALGHSSLHLYNAETTTREVVAKDMKTRKISRGTDQGKQ
jgi:hypothetical protein